MTRSPRNAAAKALIGGFALALAAGCASTQQLNEVRAEAEEAKRMAAEATARLEAAQSSIQQALEALENAYRSAGYTAVQVSVPEQELKRLRHEDPQSVSGPVARRQPEERNVHV